MSAIYRTEARSLISSAGGGRNLQHKCGGPCLSSLRRRDVSQDLKEIWKWKCVEVWGKGVLGRENSKC